MRINPGNSQLIIFVDEEDFAEASAHKWTVNKFGYAVSRINDKVVYMHRFILSPPPRISVDHKNGNRLDNRRCNLRICSSRDNVRNSKKRTGVYTSKFKGAFWDKARGKWRSEITVNYKNIYLGRFNTKEDAAMAYNTAAIKYFGEFANLNSI